MNWGDFLLYRHEDGYLAIRCARMTCPAMGVWEQFPYMPPTVTEHARSIDLKYLIDYAADHDARYHGQVQP